MRIVIKTTKETKPDGTVIETREEIRDDYYNYRYWYPSLYPTDKMFSGHPTYTSSASGTYTTFQINP